MQKINKNDVIENPLNAGVVNYLVKKKYQKSLEFVGDVTEIQRSNKRLQTHPDTIELLWEECSNILAVKCQMIIYGTPALINPMTGIIFSIAEGTYPPLLRLPLEDISILLNSEGRLTLSNVDKIYADARKLGAEWIYCFPFEGICEYLLKAYNFSGSGV